MRCLAHHIGKRRGVVIALLDADHDRLAGALRIERLVGGLQRSGIAQARGGARSGDQRGHIGHERCVGTAGEPDVAQGNHTGAVGVACMGNRDQGMGGGLALDGGFQFGGRGGGGLVSAGGQRHGDGRAGFHGDVEAGIGLVRFGDHQPDGVAGQTSGLGGQCQAGVVVGSTRRGAGRNGRFSVGRGSDQAYHRGAHRADRADAVIDLDDLDTMKKILRHWFGPL